MLFLDTTALVYACGTEHPYRAPCRSLVRAIRSGGVRATTTPEVIQEFAHVAGRLRARADAHALARDFTDLLAPLVPVAAEHVLAGLRLWEAHPRVGAFDAVLAAVAMDAADAGVVSTDRGFATIDGLHHVVPDEAGIAALTG